MPNSHDTSEMAIRHLIPRLCHLHHEQFRAMVNRLGIYRSQGAVLRQLWERDGQTPTELCAERGVKPSTITKTLQRMEQSGWLVRTKDPDDRRQTLVHLTDAGRQIEQQVEMVFAEVEQVLLQGLSEQERLLFQRLLTRVVQNLQEHADAHQRKP